MPNHVDELKAVENIQQEYQRELERHRELEFKKEELRRHLEQLKEAAKGHEARIHFDFLTLIKTLMCVTEIHKLINNFGPSPFACL